MENNLFSSMTIAVDLSVNNIDYSQSNYIFSRNIIRCTVMCIDIVKLNLKKNCV